MSRTQYYTATSIDGFIADQKNSLDWLMESGTPDDPGNQDFPQFFANVGAFCMGRTTYEWVVNHEKLYENPEKWKAYYGETPCWVFSNRKLQPIPGAALFFVSGDVGPVHSAMQKIAGSKNIWVVGGGELAGLFADQGLLDEIILSYAPVLLGDGAPLLPRRITSKGLNLDSAEKRGHFIRAVYSLKQR